jgi:hypothetical protein
LFFSAGKLILQAQSGDIFMDFLSSRQLGADSLQNIEFDLYLAVSGYEERCTYLAENLSLTAKEKVVLAYTEKTKELSRKKNDVFYSNGFKFIHSSGYETNELTDFFRLFLVNSKEKELSILIDYTCMTKTWYSSIINSLQEIEDAPKQITLYFSYCPSLFEEPPKAKSLKQIEFGFSKGKMSSSKQMALIIGLGTEKTKAEQVIKQLKPDLTLLMYADPAIDHQYTQTVFENNRELINNIEPRNLVNYPLTDTGSINEILTQKCVDLRLSHNVVICPLGPKIFALNAFLLAVRYPDIFVWNFSSMQSEKPKQKTASGEIIIQEVVFINEEEGY